MNVHSLLALPSDARPGPCPGPVRARRRRARRHDSGPSRNSRGRGRPPSGRDTAQALRRFHEAIGTIPANPDREQNAASEDAFLADSRPNADNGAAATGSPG